MLCTLLTTQPALVAAMTVVHAVTAAAPDVAAAAAAAVEGYAPDVTAAAPAALALVAACRLLRLRGYT